MQQLADETHVDDIDLPSERDAAEPVPDDPDDPDAPSDPERPSWRTSLFRRPSFGGLALAVLFWWKSLSPSLMPRSAVAEAMVSAVRIGFALLVGTFLGATRSTACWRGFDVRVPVRRGVGCGSLSPPRPRSSCSSDSPFGPPGRTSTATLWGSITSRGPHWSR